MKISVAAALASKFALPLNSHVFDGTYQHPEWLGEEPERLQRLMPA